jgi:hypothetical protein
MSTTSGARPLSQAPSSARLWRAGLVAAAAATLVNALAWVVVQQLGDAGLIVPKQPGGTELMSLPLGLVVGTTLGAAWSARWRCGCWDVAGRAACGPGRRWRSPSGCCRPAPPSASTCRSPGSSAWSCSTCWPRPPWSGWPASSSCGAEVARSPALGPGTEPFHASRGPTAGRRFSITFRMNLAIPLSTAGGLG